MEAGSEVTVEQEVETVRMKKPHVVILGAGASRAACMEGDKNGKKLPLMQDFTEIVGLKELLEGWGIDSNQNFEEIFSDLYEKNEKEKLVQIEKRVEEYFETLSLPETPTVYDHLILSLRGKDLIATFNWDPLLIQAYRRNFERGLELPKLVFLHGNVRVGYCEKDKITSIAGTECRKCGEPFKRSPLLFPIKKKNYAENVFIENEWKVLKHGFRGAFMITIFGYSGPKTDTEAIEAMKEGWGNKDERDLEQTTFITRQTEDQITENWESFIHTHHYEIHKDFYSSWIANHPRRTGEAYINQYFGAMFIEDNPIPKDLDFPELWKWFEQFKEAEEASKKDSK